MDYVCPTCGKRLPRDLKHIIPHTEQHIVDAIKNKHPKWADPDGTCKKCYDFYKSEMDFDKKKKKPSNGVGE